MFRARGLDPDRLDFAPTGTAGAKARAVEVARLADPEDSYLRLLVADLGEAGSGDEVGQVLRRFFGTTFVDARTGRRSPVPGLIAGRREALVKAARLAAEEGRRALAEDLPRVVLSVVELYDPDKVVLERQRLA
jgi:hypothetical protein